MSSSQRGRASSKAEERRRHAAEARAAQEAAERRRRLRTGALVGVVVLALVAVLAIAWQTSRTSSNGDGAAPPSATEDGGFLLGESSAPVTVTVYSDYLCPACARFEEVSGPTLDELVEAGTVQLKYHPISILDRMSSDRYSTRSASAGACAAEAGGLRPFSEAMFDEQPTEGGEGLSDERIAEIGRSAGIDDPDFAPCVEERRYTDWVGAATDRATSDGVTGTPTVLVDGEQLQSWDAESLRAAVEAAAAG